MNRRADVDLVPRPDLLGADRAPDNGTALQDQDLITGFREITRADQPVMPRADNNCVVVGVGQEEAFSVLTDVGVVYLLAKRRLETL